MPTIPPANIPVIDADGMIDPAWFEFFSRVNILGIAKAWAYVTVSGGVPTLVDSINIASISDAGVGLLDLTYETPFASSNYCAQVTCGTGGMVNGEVSARTGGTVIRLVCVNQVPAVADPAEWNFVAWGRQ